jgi:hypothetical protein
MNIVNIMHNITTTKRTKPPYNLKEGRETRKGKDGKRKTVWIGVKLVDWINTDPHQDILVWEENYTN